jgi:hypothetical protein
VLSRHGVESEEQLAKDMAELKQLREANQTEQEKLQAEAAQAKRLREQLATYAAGQMGALTAEQQAAVKAVAGDDAGRQLSAIEALRPTWGQPPAQGDGAAGQQPAGATGQPPAAPPVNPATTTQTQPAPAGGSPPPPTNQYERYKAIRAQNPILAEDFRDKYAREIAEAEAAEAQAAAGNATS